jgi:hypothetical protein
VSGAGKTECSYFSKISRENERFFKNLTRIIGTLRDDEYTFLKISRSSRLRMRNDSEKFVEKIETHIVCSVTVSSKMVPFMR